MKVQDNKVQTEMKKKKKYTPSREDNTAVLLLLLFSVLTRVLLITVPYLPGFDCLSYLLDILIALSLLWFLIYFWRQYNGKRRKHTNNH